ACRPAVSEGNEDDFVTRIRFAIPRTVLRNESSASVAIWESITLIEDESERGDMCAESVVGHDCAGDQISALGSDARVEIASPVGPGPPVKTAFDDPREIVRREIVAEHVALVDDGPQGLGALRPRQADGVADSRRIRTDLAAVRIELEYV